MTDYTHLSNAQQKANKFDHFLTNGIKSLHMFLVHKTQFFLLVVWVQLSLILILFFKNSLILPFSSILALHLFPWNGREFKFCFRENQLSKNAKREKEKVKINVNYSNLVIHITYKCNSELLSVILNYCPPIILVMILIFPKSTVYFSFPTVLLSQSVTK